MGYLGQGPKRFSEHNFIINGDLTLWQRGTSFTAFGGGGGTADAYTADRWKFVSAATDELDLDIARSATVPTYAQSGHTSQYSMFVDLDAAETAIAVDEYVGVRYALEGYEYQQMKGKWVTLSFWTRNALTGTYGVAFQTGDASKSFVREYTIDTADTWEKKVLTFQLSEDATVEELDNGVGALIYFTLDAGANYQGTANQWNAADDRTTSNQANWAGTVTNTFYIAQVKLEIGQEATAFQRHARSYQLELDAASRYYQKSFSSVIAPAQNVGVDTGEITFSCLGSSTTMVFHETFNVRMRSNAPSITLYNPAAANAQVRNETNAADCSASSVSQSDDYGFTLVTTTDAGGGTGDLLGVHYSAEDEL